MSRKPLRKTIAVFGATGDTGKHVVRQALERGYRVRGVERDWPDKFCDDPDFEQRTADVMEDDLSPIVDGCDCVISAIGLGRDPRTLADPPPLYTECAVRLVEALRDHDGTRLAVISAAFADPDVSIPLWFRAATLPLRHIFRQMADMERVLRASGNLDWTAVRAGWLLDRPFTGDYEIAASDLPAGTLRTRHADLADFLIHCVETGEWSHRSPHIARREAMHLQSPPALVEELRPA